MPMAKGIEGGKAGRRALDVGMLGHTITKHLGGIHPLECRRNFASLVAAKATVVVLATQDEAYGLYRIIRRSPVQQGKEGLSGTIADRPAMPHTCKTKPSLGIETVKARGVG